MDGNIQAQKIDCLTCNGLGALSLADGTMEVCHDCHGERHHFNVTMAPTKPEPLPPRIQKGLAAIAALLV